jgi:Ni/Co efflux regulator RcnB
MRRAITALLVTAAVFGSSGALAQGWQGGHGNNDNGGNGGQSWTGQGDGGHGRWQGRGDGGSNGQGQAQFRTQSQGGGSGDRPHWGGGQGQSNVQAGSNFTVQHNWQGGGNGGRSHWNGGEHVASQWTGNGVGWNGNDGGSARHYRQNQNGGWTDHGNDGQWSNRNGNWNNGGRHNGNWNNGRRDRHDDWRSYRDSNRGLFHLRRYDGPRGYSYQRFDRGYRIDPFFYAEQYWIDDPWQYRLPPVYGPYRWVRYFNDALLIDIRTGEVEDVINDFFW